MIYVLFNADPPERRGMPSAHYISYAFGRSESPGYLSYTDRVSKARKWKTRSGVERFLAARPNLAASGYEVYEATEPADKEDKNP